MKLFFQFLTGMIMTAGLLTGSLWADQLSSSQSALPAANDELERLRSEKAASDQRIEEMRAEREKFVKEIRRVENLNSKYSRELEDVRAQLGTQQQDLDGRLSTMESRINENAELEGRSAKSATVPEVPAATLDLEKKTGEILVKGGDLDPEDEKFKEELARAHYNMGNVYFERGEYQRAAVEYFQAVDLMPYDADAHYNLAFVSGEYIGDQETALKHYHWYLYLKPNAEDKNLVESKIVAAKLMGRGDIKTRVKDPSDSGQINISR